MKQVFQDNDGSSMECTGQSRGIQAVEVDPCITSGLEEIMPTEEKFSRNYYVLSLRC